MKVECHSFEGCLASICPLDGNRNNQIWYPDEPICGSRRLSKYDKKIIIVQRRISKKAIEKNRFFNWAMLEEIKRVHPSILGLRSD